MERPLWASPKIDLRRPNAARVYDYYLGGSHNFEVDRSMAREAIALWPELPRIIQANRAFLRRAVRFLAETQISQFLDIGSGIPTAGNVHEVVRQVAPDARVVYVDNDPVAVAHTRAILGDDRQATVVQADLHDPQRVLVAAVEEGGIDLGKPVAVLLIAVLHFLADEDDPHGTITHLCAPLTSGSYLALSHASSDGAPEFTTSHQQLYRRTPTPMTMRSHGQIARFFQHFRLLPPGLVWLPEWRPDPDEPREDHPERTTGYAGVGRKE